MIGDNIRRIREKKKITQKNLAETMGVSRQAICMWETGKREPKMKTLGRISEAFAVPLHHIIIGGVGMATTATRKAEKRVSFEYTAPTAGKVSVTGDFTSWDKNGISLKKDKSGTWKTDISLKPGKHQYKFIVDGQWRNDPTNKATVRNPFGSENSLKEVS
jgi:transcriptional regulator with XRE-family HTH domain